MHNPDGESNKSMMWMMAICCGLPLLLILVIGGGGRALGASIWVIFGGIAVMVLVSFWMKYKKYKDHKENRKAKDEHQHGGSCH